ncbi:hypothetical protein DM860_004406 [Cuscuta australis]|uniref:RING-type E3 ubiquitin transferase n=1 Tax=Cuscuta australis TaxID=267555 RepID=A0A328E7D3_9ASTE|nr:hypothetical protein DM860_004406 [Cuscuta australis]
MYIYPTISSSLKKVTMDLPAISAPPSYSHIPNHYHHLTIYGNPSLTSGPINDFPTSRSAIESLESIKVNSSFLEKEPNSCCLICAKEFELDGEVKILPCKHVFHSDCILQWLEMKSTCPVCKFQLPTQEDEDYDLLGLPRGENFIGTIISEELFNETEEEFVNLHGPPGQNLFRPDVTVDSWTIDFSMMNHSDYDREFLALASICLRLSDVLDYLFIRFCGFCGCLMESDIECVFVPSSVNISEDRPGVYLMGTATLRKVRFRWN